MTTKYLSPIAIAACLVAGTALPLAALDAAGFIHGTVRTDSGSEYTGFLRWDNEEAFWDDVFHSSKQSLDYLERYADERGGDDRSESWWEVFGKRFKVSWETTRTSRIFAARFGDIDEIEVLGKGEAEVRMKTGSTYHVEGYANDVTATIHVADATLGAIEVPWSKIERIRFSAARTWRASRCSSEAPHGNATWISSCEKRHSASGAGANRSKNRRQVAYRICEPV